MRPSAKTPRPIVERLHRELKAIITTSEFKAQIEGIGMVPMGDTADIASVEALQAFVKSEITNWGKLVRQAGIAGSQ